jgi:hypothetical protein
LFALLPAKKESGVAFNIPITTGLSKLRNPHFPKLTVNDICKSFRIYSKLQNMADI